ncbi:RNA-directed DNA polymerase [Leptospira yasudae]|uniref:RNA-directed DNA polymerase n=1 Tax=Leptospira yasudae TaxID=2202201 RepID=A0A6N4QDV5_9LEPT|nr:RNA-directed DNA polymerase [Leptospira yasudae]TGL75989.1 RNA-directed DNA polymerase [Leptospira yasudae]TGL79739.1 RNA-directed DNA polymerase [Leptospira yasudae]TGL80105.1 RNA-directed DNA polymerase [Leptospira yasudae]
MQTDGFNITRRNEYERVFDAKRMASIWRKIVKNQLRSSDILDIFDYYDFNYNIDSKSLSIRAEILDGYYRSAPPLFYRIEKKLGICRHLCLLQPSDALILQTIAESISDDILKKQPSVQSYYSRDKHAVKKPHEVQSESDYETNWRHQWKKFQREIYNFTDQKDYLVITDITNFYDSIDLEDLKFLISKYLEKDTSVLDLLFNILQDVQWRSDYLPRTRKGLPVINIEAVRLLAHSILFEIDSILDKKTNTSFVRWMDDITFAVDNRKEATLILSSVSESLQSKGLNLNLAKTIIIDQESSKKYFLIEQNRDLDNYQRKVKKNGLTNIEVKNLKREFRIHLKDKSARSWDKVTKRYLTIFGKLGDKSNLKVIPELYSQHPSLRNHILYYLGTLGYNEKSGKVLNGLLSDTEFYDDISKFQIVKLLNEWKIPRNAEGLGFIKEIDKNLKFSTDAFDFYCSLWFKAKYSDPEGLLSFIKKYSNFWTKHSFIRRQTTAVLSKLLTVKELDAKKILEIQISSGLQDTVSIATSIQAFSKMDRLENKVQMYFFPENKLKIYPFNKFIVLCAFLNSHSIRNNQVVKLKILKSIDDPFYTYWLDAYYSIG